MTDLNTAYAAIPGYQDELAFQAKARTGFTLAPSYLEEAMTAFSDAYRDAITTGSEPPIDAAEAVLDARRHDEVLALFNQEFKRVRATSRDRLSQILREGGDAAFQHLANELDTLGATVRDCVAALEGKTTAAGVLASGKSTVITAWQRLGELVDPYDKIRAAQQALLRGHGDFESTYPKPNDVLYSTALYRNTLDVSTYFLKKRQDAASQSVIASDYTAWLRAAHDTQGLDSYHSWWPEGDRTEALIRIFTRGEPWIPTPTTLNAAHTTAHRAIEPIRPGNGGDTEAYLGQLQAAALHARRTHRHHTHGEPLDGPHASSGNLSKKHHQIAKKISAEAASFARMAANN